MSATITSGDAYPAVVMCSLQQLHTYNQIAAAGHMLASLLQRSCTHSIEPQAASYAAGHAAWDPLAAKYAAGCAAFPAAPLGTILMRMPCVPLVCSVRCVLSRALMPSRPPISGASSTLQPGAVPGSDRSSLNCCPLASHSVLYASICSTSPGFSSLPTKWHAN
jgi:hypothetical protein